MGQGEELKEALSHVLWIGGPPDTGKTSVAEVLVSRYGLQIYHFDDHAERFWLHHFSNDPTSHGYAWMAKNWDERWVLPLPVAMAAEAVHMAQECFPLILADLLAMPAEPCIVAEGFELLPALVAPVLANRQQALWLLPTEAFQYDAFVRRGKPAYHQQATDPGLAAHNHFARDRCLAQQLHEQVQAYKLHSLIVDHSLSLSTVVQRTVEQFAPVVSRFAEKG